MVGASADVARKRQEMLGNLQAGLTNIFTRFLVFEVSSFERFIFRHFGKSKIIALSKHNVLIFIINYVVVIRFYSGRGVRSKRGKLELD